MSENIAEKYGIDTSYEHKTGCPRCISKGSDNSRDNLKVYGSGKGAYCWSCGFTILSDDEREARGVDDYEEEEEEVMTKEPITPEENAKIKTYTGTKSKGWRGIKDETNVGYGIRYSYDEETGEPDKMFVPTTINGELSGYKTRRFPKDFTAPIGITGKQCELAGQFRFKDGGKTIVIVGGEVDMVSAFQMLRDYQISKGGEEYAPTAVVSPTIGESGAVKQIQGQYAFFDKFEKIIVGMDNDTAGLKAMESIVSVLPKGKVCVAYWSKKDPNAMLQAGMQKQFVSDFFNAKPYVPMGIVGSGDLSGKIREEIETDKIAFPPFMHEVNEMTAGGLGLRKIMNVGAASGIGKTVYVDTMVYHWIFNCPYRIGVVSMELSAPQYGQSMLSRHIGVKISNIKDKKERIALLDSPEVQKKQQELFFREDGSHRWHLVDDRDGSIEELQKIVERLVIECDCQVIILDPIQDILDGLSNEEQAVFMKWQKGMVKSHAMSFININHVRKSGSGGTQNSNGGMISEEDFAGSSTLFKSAALNLLLVRDKMNEDPIIRNTTKAFISKNRDNGITGPAGEYYYCNDSHTLWAKDKWMEINGPKDF